MKKRFTPLLLASIVAFSLGFNSCEEEEKPIISTPAVLENVPKADFAFEKDFLKVTFDASISENAKVYSWNFGDGSDGASGATTTHTFKGDGEYTVILTVNNLGEVDKDAVKGLVDTKTVKITVSDKDIVPTSSFTVAVEGAKAKFTNTSEMAVSYEWDFGVEGDNTDVSTSKNPIFTYAETGTYTVTLISKSADDITETSIQEVSVVKPVIVGATIVNGSIDDFDASGEVKDSPEWKAIRDKNNDDWEAPSALQSWVKANVASGTVTAGITTSENTGVFALKLSGIQRRAYQQIAVETGKTYKITFFSRSDAAVDAVAHMRAYVFDAEILDETTIDTNLGTTDIVGSNKKYVQYTLEFTATSDVAVFYLRTLDAEAGYLDDVSIEVSEMASKDLVINGSIDDFDASGEVKDSPEWKAIRDKNNDDWEAPSALQSWVKANVASGTVTAGITTSENTGVFALKLSGIQRRAYQQIAVETGKTYKITFFSRSDAAVDAVAHMRAYVFDSEILDETTIDTNLGTTDIVGSGGKYIEYTLEFTATSNIAVFYLRTLDAEVGYIDDISMIEK